MDRYDAFGEAAVVGRDRRGTNLLAMRSAVLLFWVVAAVLVSGRLYVEQRYELPFAASTRMTPTRIDAPTLAAPVRP